MSDDPQKLFSSPAPGQVIWPHYAAEGLRDHFQDKITCLMTKCIIDLLEMVYVNK